jgi:predicted nucleotidyltransferase component of viral defense system
MIRKEEILEHSEKYRLPPDIIEKDYMLGWILAGIASRPNFTETWVFKGGTCLKKCYFEEYRFSEDLDYTLTNAEHVNLDFLNNEFVQVSDWVNGMSGASLSKITFEKYLNPQGKFSIQGKIQYHGPMARRGDAPKIKLDLTTDELLVFQPEKRAVYHPYSDVPKGGLEVTSYCIEEIFSEKIRAMVQRLRPRDLYDVINLYQFKRSQADKHKLLEALKQKSIFKNVKLPTLELMDSMESKKDMFIDWEIMLGHQISDLPHHEFYWSKLPEMLEWLYS